MKQQSKSRVQQINEIKKLIREPFLFISILVIFYLLIVFVIFPIFQVFKTSFMIDGQLSLKNYRDVLRQSYYIRPLFNSILLGLIVATIGTFVGFVFAYAITRTPMRGKGIFRLIATFPMVSPPFVVALACILLFGRSGIFAGAIGNIYGLTGLTVVETIAYAPTAFLVLIGVLQAIDPSLEEAAMDFGAYRGKVFSTIIFPLALPGIVSAWLLVFIQSLADFGAPMISAGTTRCSPCRRICRSRGCSTRPWLHVGDPPAAPTVIAFYLQKYLLSKKSYVTVTES